MKTNLNIKNRVAIVGAGLTLFRRRMLDTPKELAWGAVKMALESAGLDIKDVEAVVIGSAPDAFDGVHMKGEYLSDGSGGIGKPTMRVYVGGGTGVFTPIAGWWHVASGLFDVVIAVAEEKMSPAQPHPQYVFKHIWDPIIERPLGLNLIWIFAMEMHRYMYRYNIKKEDVALVSVKNKANALDHPAAQAAGKITVDDVLKSEILVWPVQRLDISPVSDGAAAIVMVSEKIARRLTDSPVWVEGVGWALDSTHWTNRDLSFSGFNFALTFIPILSSFVLIFSLCINPPLILSNDMNAITIGGDIGLLSLSTCKIVYVSTIPTGSISTYSLISLKQFSQNVLGGMYLFPHLSHFEATKRPLSLRVLKNRSPASPTV